MSRSPAEIDLPAIFQRINLQHFDGFLELPELRWNSRLRSSAGRFITGGRSRFGYSRPAVIEIAFYLLGEKDADSHIADTMAHEMIHYWLWVRRRPWGHTAEFLAKMRIMGVKRYNTIPKQRPHKYAYRCPGCEKEFLARKRLGVLACQRCCREHSGGRYDARFKLYLHRELAGDQARASGDESGLSP
ncbi:MAG TPA: SprT-like domain-containing protein [Bdellovibrionota bacterium]|nr:SprT-like domain-containing protein [Bdellovibrionota bacterium]